MKLHEACQKAFLRVFIYPALVTFFAIIPAIKTFLFIHAGIGYLLLLVCFPYFCGSLIFFCLKAELQRRDLVLLITLFLGVYVGLTYIFSLIIVAGIYEISNAELVNIWNSFFFPIYFIWSNY